MTSIEYPASGAKAAPGRRLLWTRAAVLLVLLLAAGLGLVGWSAWQERTPVTLVVDGRKQVVYTTARSAQDLLERLGYTPHANDIVMAPGGTLDEGARIEIRRARPVLVDVDGRTLAVRTQATTVGSLLNEQDIVLGWKDEVFLAGEAATMSTVLPPVVWRLPQKGLPVRPWEAQADPLRLQIRRALSITLIDNDAAPATIRTRAATLGEALAAEQVPVFAGDIVFPSLSTPVQAGQWIVIQRATPVEIEIDGSTVITRTRQASVGGALAEQGIVIMGMDEVTPALSRELRPGIHIKVTRVREEVQYEDELLPYETVWEPDDALPIDQRQVASAGGPGLLRHRYRLRYENGEEVARTLEDSWVAVEPQTRVIAYGRRITPQTLETPSGPITYWRKVRMYATSYSPARSGTPRSAPWYGRTRIGLTLRKGVVAVDPGVVNMEQRLYVPEYGEAVAGDTGGGVVGRHIDLGFSDHDYQSWHWWTDVYLLWPPPPTYAIHYVLPNWPRYPDRGR